MHFSDILLVILSSVGLIHGLFIGTFLCFFRKKRTLSRFLLGLLLILMALRIGKSVLLYFSNTLEPLFIFIGLAFLLAIGPILRWYTLAMTIPKYSLPKYAFFEVLPFGLVLFMSLFIRADWFHANNHTAIVLFAVTIIFIYCHLAFYIFCAGRIIQKIKKNYKGMHTTKSQKAILKWLQFIIIGCAIIWLSYVLNIIEDTVPYIIGPLMYAVVIYLLTYKAYKLRALELNGNAFKENDDIRLFRLITTLFEEQQIYLETDVSLQRISTYIGKNTQKTSEIINQYAQRNFNDFINYYRIEASKKLLVHPQKQQYTISSIAFDTGFSSLSSFNSALKKFEGETPSVYRKREYLD